MPADAQRIRIAVLFRGPGTAWFDDLEFSAVDTAVARTGRVLGTWPAPPKLQGLAHAPRDLGFEPDQLAPVASSVFSRTEVQIPMRDGVRLFTVIAAPRAASEPLPILLTRTPYGARPMSYRDLITDGYIFVSQDIRGRNRSEGSFVMNRPARDRRDAASVDETTDAYDTVEWLIRNVPNNNGRVGVFGLSYDGWLAEVVLLDPHPAVKPFRRRHP